MTEAAFLSFTQRAPGPVRAVPRDETPEPFSIATSDDGDDLRIEIRGPAHDVVRTALLIDGMLELKREFAATVRAAWIDPTGTRLLLTGDDWNAELERAASKIGVNVQLRTEPEFERYVEAFYEPRGESGPDGWKRIDRRA